MYSINEIIQKVFVGIKFCKKYLQALIRHKRNKVEAVTFLDYVRRVEAPAAAHLGKLLTSTQNQLTCFSECLII